MMKHFVILICLFLSTMEVSASRQNKEKGDSIYDRMVELSLLPKNDQFQQEKDAANWIRMRHFVLLRNTIRQKATLAWPWKQQTA